MPNIHIQDWNKVKKADFPRFNCLCELCDCGCFERSNKLHTKICNSKSNDSVAAYFNMPSVKAGPSDSLYQESYKRNICKTKRPEVLHEPAGHIQIGDKHKALAKSTNNEDFKFWDKHDTVQTVAEKPELTSKLMYPNNKRRHLTTNDEFLLSNHGVFKAKQTAANMFENSYKIDQNNYSKIGLDNLSNTVYKDDFIKASNSKAGQNQREGIITKEKFENSKNHKIGKSRIPMDMRTNNMHDFMQFDAELYRDIVRSKNTRLSANVFESSLKNGCKPSDDNGSPSIFTSRSTNGFRRTSDLKQFNSPDSISLDNELIDNTPESTYQFGYKNSGVDLCMSKAYKKLEKNIL